MRNLRVFIGLKAWISLEKYVLSPGQQLHKTKGNWQTTFNAREHRGTDKIDTLDLQILISDLSFHVPKVISGHERSPPVFWQ